MFIPIQQWKFLDGYLPLTHRQKSNDPKGYSLLRIIICFNVHDLKWEGSTLLSSLDFKQSDYKSFFSTLSLIRDFIEFDVELG